MYLAGSTVDGTVYMVVYADSAGAPGALIATSNGGTILVAYSGQWWPFTFSTPFNVTAGQSYWIGIYADTPGTTGGSNGPMIWYTNSILGDYQNVQYNFKNQGNYPPPNPFGAGTLGSARSLSAYLVVDTGGPQAPAVTTSAAAGVTLTSAILEGSANPKGEPT